MNRYRRLLKDSVIFAIGGFASKAMSFFLVPFYAMYLSTEQFGTADLTITTVNFLLPVMSLSLADAVLRFSYDSGYKTAELLRCAYTEMYFSVFVLFIIAVLNEEIFSLFPSKYILYGICIYFLQNSGLILSNYLKANSKLGLYTVQGFISTLLMLTSNILFLAVFKTGVDGYLMSIVISSFAGNMIMICFGRIPLLCFLPLRKPDVLKDLPGGINITGSD